MSKSSLDNLIVRKRKVSYLCTFDPKLPIVPREPVGTGPRYPNRCYHWEYFEELVRTAGLQPAALQLVSALKEEFETDGTTPVYWELGDKRRHVHCHWIMWRTVKDVRKSRVWAKGHASAAQRIHRCMRRFWTPKGAFATCNIKMFSPDADIDDSYLRKNVKNGYSSIQYV